MLNGRSLDGVFVCDSDEVRLFNRQVARLEAGNVQVFQRPDNDMEPDEYHRELSKVWRIPDKYTDKDVLQELEPKATHPGGLDRLRQEMDLFQSRGMLPVLQCTMYLVDMMREHGVVWGVGRGSSVASYVLFLIGINRINPLDHGLEITEFLR